MKHTLLALFIGFALVAPVWVSAALPEFAAINPRGIQRGTEIPVTFTGNRLDDFEGVIFFSPGFTLKSVTKVEKNKVSAVLAVAPDVPLGNHRLRLRTRTGLSFVRQIFVGPYAGVEEKEPNNDRDTAQVVDFNQTLEGVITNEDVDYFKINAKKGQRISLEVEGLRLGYGFFDPFISLQDKNRFELASSDDTMLLRQDGYLSVIAPEDGEYSIMVRESSYRGSPNSFYRLHVGNFVRPDVCYPAGGKIGSKVKVKFIEKNGDVIEQEVEMPAVATKKHMVFLNENPAPSGNIMMASPFDNFLEVEPNDKEANQTNMEVPLAINGIIEKPNDEDRFVVKLKKGMKVDFYGYAQSLGSPLDPVLIVTNSKGAGLGSNDDGGGSAGRRLDCKLTITAPEDGDYTVIIKDHLQRGGPNYVYRIEAVASVPEITFSSPHFAVNDSHKRQFMPIPKGGYYATLANVTRNNASGDMTFDAKDLPPGVKLLTTTMSGAQTGVPLLFHAAPDAPLGGTAATVTLQPTKPEQNYVGRLAQVFDMVRVGNIVYYTETEDKLPVAVVEEAPYTLEIIKPAVPIVQNGLLDLKVVAKRKEGHKAPIRVLMLWRPPGMNSQGEVEIPADKNEATFTLDCNANVAPGTYQLTVLGESDAGNGIVYQAAPYCDVIVQPAYLTGTMELAVVEQGKEVDLVCKIEHTQPFEGEATAQIFGFPTNGISISEAKIKKDSNEVIFKVKTEPSAPVGKHATLFCQVNVPVQGGTTIHRIAAGTTLRVDAPKKNPPPAAPKPAPAVVAEKKPAAEPPKKQLSRLEQLRLEQSQAGQ